MAALTVELVHRKVFDDIDSARVALEQVTRSIESRSRARALWTGLFGAPLEVNAENLAVVLAEENHTRQGPTHSVVVAVHPEGAETGTIYLGVGPKARDRGDVVGLRFIATLDDADFDLSRESMATLLAETVEAVQADEGFIGPDEWGRTRRVGWATYVPDDPSSTEESALAVLEGLGLVTSRVARGAVVEAHGEEPSSTSAAAKEAVDLVRRVLDDPASPPVAPVAAPAMPKQIPTYLRSPGEGSSVTVRAREERPSQAPSVLTMGTLPALDGPAPVSTPFVRAKKEDAPPIEKAEAAPRPLIDAGAVDLGQRGPDLLTSGTVVLDEAPLAASTPFIDSTAEPSSVSDYARLSAELLHSNDRDALFNRHRLTPESYVALATHWRERMRDDAQLREAFYRLFQQWNRKLARSGAPR